MYVVYKKHFLVIFIFVSTLDEEDFMSSSSSSDGSDKEGNVSVLYFK